ncbi:unnamed protein product [Plutella xylostella]|uniref:(diamondback moth) hypothetical protein n=1 Tax=Plutella xylostella TaxID=51655 RepID=A0A8S4GG06_PLUXY|nr:unnamed protein product [Plutella xylostella]
MCWTDSTIVLGWLRMAPSLLKTFVQNRVVEIHELTKDTPWRHVSGTDNPADLVSRGVALEVLASSGLWWEGPQFLHDPNFACGDVPVGTWSKQNVELPEVKADRSSRARARRHFGVNACWTMNGAVFIKLADGNKVRIVSAVQLDELCRKHPAVAPATTAAAARTPGDKPATKACMPATSAAAAPVTRSKASVPSKGKR